MIVNFGIIGGQKERKRESKRMRNTEEQKDFCEKFYMFDVCKV